MINIVLIGTALFIAIAISIFLVIRRKKKSPKADNSIQELQDVLQGNLDESATGLVKEFQSYFRDKNSPYNRRQRRRIKRHYMKFLWKWLETPSGARNVDHIVNYLIQDDWNNDVVGRWVALYVNGKHEESYMRRKDASKKAEADKKKALQKPHPIEVKEEEVENVG